MATDKPRYNITVDEDLLEEIEKYRYENKIATRSGATVELLRKGMEALIKQKESEEGKKNKPLTDQEAGEAMRALLHYRFERQPTKEEMDLFSTVLPILTDGVKDKGE